MQESVSETLHLLFSQPRSFSPQVYIWLVSLLFSGLHSNVPFSVTDFLTTPFKSANLLSFLPVQTIPSPPFTLFFSTSTYHCKLMYYVFTYCLSSPRRMFKFQEAGICVCFVHCHTLSTQDSARHIGDQ